MTETPRIDGSIVAELLCGELPNWHVGVCTLTVTDADEILVSGENDQPVARVDTDRWTASAIDEIEVKDTAAIAATVNSAIEYEHDQI